MDVGSGHKVNIGLKKLLLWVEGVEFSGIVCVGGTCEDWQLGG